jgi:type II secretory pathway predicted ATPase ExeA/cell division septation protein DedD
VNNEFSRALQDAGGTPGRSSASLTYEPFYGLKEKPFSLSADPRFLFKSPSHAPAFDALLAGIRRREGLIVLTGEIGTGKTTLCRSVLQNLDRRTFAAFVPDPFVSREDLLKMLLVDFGVVSVSDLKRGRLNDASRTDLSYALYEFLDSLVPLQAFAVLIIDEAQNLSSSLLEEVRILSDLERRVKLLQVMLVGQPELRASLKLPQMRQVDQRISVRCELEALDAEGAAGYVKYRLGVASDGNATVEFTDAALDAVYQGSSGVPRLINRICDRALQHAYWSQSDRVEAKVVWDAIEDLGLSPASGIEERRQGVPEDSEERQGVQSVVLPFVPAVEQPPVPAEPALITRPLEEIAPALAEFAEEGERRSEAPALRAHPARRGWIAIAAAWALAVSTALGAGMWYLQAQTIDTDAVAAMLPAPPPVVASQIALPVVPDAAASGTAAAPAAPVAGAPAEDGNYIIQVASFESRGRAARLVEELTTAGYDAREVELDLGPPRGRLVQVIVGGYSSAIDVERDLRRIRELPGYGDARLLER